MFVVETKEEKVNKTFRLSLKLVHRLEKVAKSKDTSVNYLVAWCCEYALNDMIDKKDER